MADPVIVDWLDWYAGSALVHSGSARNRSDPIFGGPWKPVGSWKEYLQSYPERSQPYLAAFRNVILQHGFRGGDSWSDRRDRWVPVFNDGSLLVFGSDAWAELQAAIWSEQEGVAYTADDWMFAIGGEEPLRDHEGKLTYRFKIYEPSDPAGNWKAVSPPARQ